MTSAVALILMLTVGLQRSDARIRRLPPSAFPELPANLMEELQRRSCRIPQAHNRKLSNVIQGEFSKPGQTDWAVLCSTKKITTLLVFWNGSVEQVAEVVTRPNGFSNWSIRPVAERQFSNTPWGWKGPKPSQIDHQGVSSWLEFGEPTPGHFSYDYSAEGTTLYYYQGRWLDAGTMIVN